MCEYNNILKYILIIDLNIHYEKKYFDLNISFRKFLIFLNQL